MNRRAFLASLLLSYSAARAGELQVRNYGCSCSSLEVRNYGPDCSRSVPAPSGPSVQPKPEGTEAPKRNQVHQRVPSNSSTNKRTNTKPPVPVRSCPNGICPRRLGFAQPWIENSLGHTTVNHLITVHGFSAEQLAPYANNRLALNRIHGYAHTRG